MFSVLLPANDSIYNRHSREHLTTTKQELHSSISSALNCLSKSWRACECHRAGRSAIFSTRVLPSSGKLSAISNRYRHSHYAPGLSSRIFREQDHSTKPPLREHHQIPHLILNPSHFAPPPVERLTRISEQTTRIKTAEGVGIHHHHPPLPLRKKSSLCLND